jgi:hypothetical protein
MSEKNSSSELFVNSRQPINSGNPASCSSKIFFFWHFQTILRHAYDITLFFLGSKYIAELLIDWSLENKIESMFTFYQRKLDALDRNTTECL